MSTKVPASDSDAIFEQKAQAPYTPAESCPPADADPVDLPENAFRELGKDENYRPVMHPARQYTEVNIPTATDSIAIKNTKSNKLRCTAW